MRIEILGWVSSAILVLTIVTQILEQWRQGSSKAVSPWLFIGQLAASTGFLIYSIPLKSYVFIVTNSLMMLSAIIGVSLVMWHRRKRSREQGASAGGSKAGEGGYVTREPAMARR